MDAKLSLELYFAPKISGNLMLSLKVPEYKYIFSCHLFDTLSQLFVVFICENYTLLQKEKKMTAFI
jgi:hypothetical protein